ncbi:MAG: hypothetical protein BWY74_02082 [Firmicutes bacterium ADurb.Bin419]|nr:MAG: hypothetical protein BWY74_02082 [Firmicutes bacterium ADurb.Bin419]
MLYRYFLGKGETNIESVEKVYRLYRKGMINPASKLYDVGSNVYVTAAEIPEFKDVFEGTYSKEGKHGRMLRYIISFVVFLLVLLISAITAFLNLGIDEMKNNTTYFFVAILGTFIGVAALMVLGTLICIKASKKYDSFIVLSFSIVSIIVSILLLVNTIG